MNKSQKKAFTLIEVLVATAVIGLVASLTIPNFFANSQSSRNQYVAGLRKTYAEFDYATQQIKLNNSGTLVGAFADSDAIVTKYCQYMKCSKTCGLAASISEKCWTEPNKYLGGYQPGAGWTVDAEYRSFILADGTLVLEELRSSACSDVHAWTNGTSCAHMYVDVNGFKGPNIVGRDIFMFFIQPNKFLPAGESGNLKTYTTFCDSANPNPGNGRGCAGRVLQDGRMLY